MIVFTQNALRFLLLERLAVRFNLFTSIEQRPKFVGGPEFRSEFDCTLTPPQMNWTFNTNKLEFNKAD